MNVKMLASAYALVLPCVVWAAGDTSEPITAFLRTEETSFWCTAKGATVTLPIDFPEGATTARGFRRESRVSICVAKAGDLRPIFGILYNVFKGTVGSLAVL